MALSDWTQHVVGTPTVQIHTATPIVSAGSLQIASTTGQKALLLSNLYTLGKVKGRIRTLVRLDAVNGTDTYRCGFTLFQSAANITSTGSLYTYGLEFQSSTLVNNVFFDACVSGLDAGRTRYFTGSTFSRTNGTTIIALEVEWAYEPILLGGTRFIFREGHGVLTDFSNLVEVGRFHLYPGTGSNPPLLTTSAGEGIFSVGGLASTLIDVKFDRTTVVQLT